MKIIIGLGNPGKNYERTRHNAGFLFLDYLAQKTNVSFQAQKKFGADTAEVHIRGEKYLLVKPTLYMNLSGQSVGAVLNYFKIGPENMVVIHDDLDVKSGHFKETFSSRSAGHNGVQNIIDQLCTQDFRRLRVGIGSPVETLGVCMPTHDYVLGQMNSQETESLESLFPQLAKLIFE